MSPNPALAAEAVNPAEPPSLPLVIQNVQEVDDAGGTHYECVMTGRYIYHITESKLLRLTGNIRPDHERGMKLIGKTAQKVNKWTTELNDNEAVIGNMSMRLDPDKTTFRVEYNKDTNQYDLIVEDGYFDCAVDSLSRLKSIIKAVENPLRTFNLNTRFAVRIWVLHDPMAKKVATIYNTRGDKVNDPAAKWAWSETKVQELARKLVVDSPHLRQDNVETTSNAVSANSHKLTAYNTIAKAMEVFWQDEPITEADVDAEGAWLVTAWDSLVRARPEYGLLSTTARKAQRRKGIASSGVIIFGLISVMSTMYLKHVDPAVAFKAIDDPDLFDFKNKRWQEAGVVIPSGAQNASWTTSNSFSSRRAASRVLHEVMGLSTEDADL